MIKILWADDQVDVITTFSHTLAPLEAEIEYVADGEKALEAIKKRSYDIALIDLAMPPGQWGGLWLLNEINQININLPIVIVSGEGTQQETIQAIRLGAYDYVTKEKLDEELLDRVQHVLEQILSKEKDKIYEIIQQGESENIEFKSTLRWNINAQKHDPVIELAVVKTIAAFLNTSGGTLIIGVNDSGSIVGIKLDQFPNEDKFQLHFWNKVRDMIGVEYSEYIKAEVILMGKDSLFKVQCRPSKRPVIVRSNKQELFFVRTGPKTEELDLSKALKYIKDHFRE